MVDYRVYFLGGGSIIRAAHWFQADDDDSAMWIADQLADACSDICRSFELWQHTRYVGGSAYRDGPAETAESVNARRQEQLVQHEEHLRDSGFAIGQSRRLLESLAHAKQARLG